MKSHLKMKPATFSHPTFLLVLTFFIGTVLPLPTPKNQLSTSLVLEEKVNLEPTIQGNGSRTQFPTPITPLLQGTTRISERNQLGLESKQSKEDIKNSNHNSIKASSHSDNSDFISTSSMSTSFLLTSGTRQIGNSREENPPSILNLHEKVNGMQLTDVAASSDPPFGFRTGSVAAASSILKPKNEATFQKEQNVNSFPSRKSFTMATRTNVEESKNSLTAFNNKTETNTASPQSLYKLLPGQNFKNVEENKNSSVGETRESNTTLFSDLGLRDEDMGQLVKMMTKTESFSTDLYLEGERGDCVPVIVNQTNDDAASALKDMDKWTQTLVKITKCVANCLDSLQKKMKKTFKRKDGRSDLSTCQKSCEIPQKSTHNNNKLGTTKTLQQTKQTEETNKTQEPQIKDTDPNHYNRHRLTPTNKNSSTLVNADNANSNYGGSQLTFLHWPKFRRSKNTTIIYIVIVEDASSMSRWKLIDQTASEETEISLLFLDQICQINPVVVNTVRQSLKGGEKTIRENSNNIEAQAQGSLKLKVLAVEGSKGLLSKVFSGSLSLDNNKISFCCQNHPKEGKKKEEEKPNSYKNFKNLNLAKGNKNEENNKNSNSVSNKINWKSSKDDNQVNPKFKTVGKPNSRGNELYSKMKSRSPFDPNVWGLKMLSMVYENFLVTTEISWNVPSLVGKGNKEGESHQFLLTWEIFGGGIKGNLVTEGTSGTISLWPDTAYFIQVGLIDGEDPRNLGEQNYMKALLGGSIDESITFPLDDGQPKVSFTSERLLVNTSQLSIPKTKTGSSSPSKSNNPPWQGEKRNKLLSVIPVDGHSSLSDKGANGQRGNKEYYNPQNFNEMMGDDGKEEEKVVRSHVPPHFYLYNDGPTSLRKNESKNEGQPRKSSTKSQQHPINTNVEAYRPDGYQGLFMNLGLGGYNYDHEEDEGNGTADSSHHSPSSSSVSEAGASVIYSIFVLVVVACVIFLFLVAFIGFFVVSSSISQTAQYFIPKRLKIWVVGGASESELLANAEDGGGEEEEGRFVDDMDDDGAEVDNEWGDIDVGERRRENLLNLTCRT